jgi:L-ribulose-5-phosphate 3-epimerase
MPNNTSRRDFMRAALTGGGLASLAGRVATAQSESRPGKYDFDISLAGWSLHRTIGRGKDQKDMIEMPAFTRETFDIGAIELVNGMLSSTKPDYFDKLAKNAADNNIKILLIMVDGQGEIGSDDQKRRDFAVKRHKFWVDVAADLGCHSIRMNWKGDPKGVMENAELLDKFITDSVPGFRALCDYGEKKNINILLENHWGPSSCPDAVEKLAKAIDHPRWGTLPDFGNFPEDVDRYEATDRLMEYARAVSAKCYDFDPATGEDTKIDFGRMLEIVCGKHGYDSYIGIEYEGGKLAEAEGIKAAQALLEKHRR